MGVVDGVIIQIALGLTPAEARVVMTLREKHDLDAVAASLHVSLSTVKSHLKHAFAKSGARKQSDLLSMVERLVAQAPRLADTVAGMSNREVNG